MQSHRDLSQPAKLLHRGNGQPDPEAEDFGPALKGECNSEEFRLSLSGHFITRAAEALQDGQVMRAAIYVDAAYEIFRLQIERAHQRALKAASTAADHSSTQAGWAYGDNPQLVPLRPLNKPAAEHMIAKQAV